MAQSRLHEALSRVESVLDLKNTIDAVEKAINEKNYELAAKNTHRVLHLQKPIENDVNTIVSLAHTDCVVWQVSFEQLVGLERRLRTLVIAEVEEAEKASNMGKLLKSCQLFPLLNMPYRGLAAYCQAVRRHLASELHKQSLTLAAQPPGSVIQYIEVITRVIDRVATAVQQHIQVVQVCAVVVFVVLCSLCCCLCCSRRSALVPS